MKGRTGKLTLLLFLILITSACTTKAQKPYEIKPIGPTDALAVEMTWTCDARDSCGRCVRATCRANSVLDAFNGITCIDLAAQCMASGHKWEGWSGSGSCTAHAPLDFDCP